MVTRRALPNTRRSNYLQFVLVITTSLSSKTRAPFTSSVTHNTVLSISELIVAFDGTERNGVFLAGFPLSFHVGKQSSGN